MRGITAVLRVGADLVTHPGWSKGKRTLSARSISSDCAREVRSVRLTRRLRWCRCRHEVGEAEVGRWHCLKAVTAVG